MKTTYRFCWRTLSLWRERTWRSSSNGSSTTYINETTCLFSLLNPKSNPSKATH